LITVYYIRLIAEQASTCFFYQPEHVIPCLHPRQLKFANLFHKNIIYKMFVSKQAAQV